MKLLICLSILFLVFTCQLLYIIGLKEIIFAESPSFARQEVTDDMNDLINMVTGRITNGSRYLDIESVTYSSDGNFLYANLWLASLNEQPTEDFVAYGVWFDVDLNNNTGYQGLDYKVELFWDKENQNWTRIVAEIPSSGKSERPIETQFNTIPGFFGSVPLYVDLGKMHSPDQYRLFFYAYTIPDRSNFESGYPLDLVRGIYVPTLKQKPPISISLPEINLVPGERYSLPLQINSTIGLYTYLHLPQDIVQRNIKLHFDDKMIDRNNNALDEDFPNRITIGLPPNSAIAIPMDIIVPSGAPSGQYTLSIPSATLTLPREVFDITTTSKREFIPVQSSILQSGLGFNVKIGKAPNIFDINIPYETFISIFIVVITAIIGWFIPSIARWLNGKRQGKHVRVLMTRIIDAYDSLQSDKSKAGITLKNIKNDVAQTYAMGKITETQYEILNDKISEYEEKINAPEN